MPLPPVFRSHGIILPKQGHTTRECEDALASNDATATYAVADGASESIQAGEWARLLAESYVADPPEEANFSDWLETIKKRWLFEMGNHPVPWYIEEKLREGAFATFLGLKVGANPAGGFLTWRALAVGDCCLFRMRANSEVRSFPMLSAENFGTRPDLIGSRSVGAPRLQSSEGSVQVGDCLILASDALAQWFLAQYQAGGKPWETLARLSNEGFADWANEQRHARHLKNDDVALLEIRVEFPD